MIENGNRDPEYLTLFLCFILAVLGGTAKELSKIDECFTWKKFGSNVFIAGFCGIMIGLFAPDFEHKNWIMCAAGISGVMGIAFLNFCEEILKEVISNIANNHSNNINKEKRKKH